MEEDELDPRIQVELEKLNTATDEINRLEIELDEANTTFRMLLGECTRRLQAHGSKLGGCVAASRPYHQALDAARQAQQECQQAAVAFQRANEIHEAAKETVMLTETRFKSQPEWRFDAAWQDVLNHATLRVRDAAAQRAEGAARHGAATARYEAAQEKVHRLEQRLKRSIAKSRPYFEEKSRCNDQLAAQKEVVETLQRCVGNIKRDYAGSLRRLEGISEEIHRKRADVMGACPGIREPGVGAELEYRGELDRCDVQSESSDGFAGQSGSSSYGGRREEIREAVVVSTMEMMTLQRPGKSTKPVTHDAASSTDLKEDFRRAQTSGWTEPSGSRRRDLTDGTESCLATAETSRLRGSSNEKDCSAGSSDRRDSKEDEDVELKSSGSQAEGLKERQDPNHDCPVFTAINEADGSNHEDVRETDGLRSKDSLGDNVAGGGASKAAAVDSELESKQQNESPEAIAANVPELATAPQSSGPERCFVDSASGDSELEKACDAKDSERRDFEEAELSGESRPSNQTEGSSNEGVNKGVNEGASIAQEEGKGDFVEVESKEREQDNVSAKTKTIEGEDNK